MLLVVAEVERVGQKFLLGSPIGGDEAASRGFVNRQVLQLPTSAFAVQHPGWFSPENGQLH